MTNQSCGKVKKCYFLCNPKIRQKLFKRANFGFFFEGQDMKPARKTCHFGYFQCMIKRPLVLPWPFCHSMTFCRNKVHKLKKLVWGENSDIIVHDLISKAFNQKTKPWACFWVTFPTFVLRLLAWLFMTYCCSFLEKIQLHTVTNMYFCPKIIF